MHPWTPKPPTPSQMGDHDVPPAGTHLENKRIALLVCGGIAAMKSPMIARSLRRFGADVVAYLSPEASRYVTTDTLSWATNNPVINQLSPRSEHLSIDKPFDAYVVAPATYNTINKFRSGIADTSVATTLASALGLMEKGQTRIFIAPTMHGDLHNSILQESLLTLQKKGVILIPPRDDYGKHNIPDSELISAYVCAGLSQSNLKGQKILVTAGPTPAPIDNVRAITNRFRGRLGVEIAKELSLRGAHVVLLLGAGSVSAPPYVEVVKSANYHAYRSEALRLIKDLSPAIGIFSAAVADYMPKQKFDGKIPSGGAMKSIELTETEKVIDLAQKQAPQMKLISFKYQEKIELEALLDLARSRVLKGHAAVVANRGEEQGPNGEQVAYLVSPNALPKKMTSKYAIAKGLCDFLEN